MKELKYEYKKALDGLVSFASTLKYKDVVLVYIENLGAFFEFDDGSRYIVDKYMASDLLTRNMVKKHVYVYNDRWDKYSEEEVYDIYDRELYKALFNKDLKKYLWTIDEAVPILFITTAGHFSGDVLKAFKVLGEEIPKNVVAGAVVYERNTLFLSYKKHFRSKTDVQYLSSVLNTAREIYTDEVLKTSFTGDKVLDTWLKENAAKYGIEIYDTCKSQYIK